MSLIKESLPPGAIVFSTPRETSRLSGAIIESSRKIGGEITFSHCGVIVNHGMIIHASSTRGVIIEPLKKFIDNAGAVAREVLDDADVADRGFKLCYQQIGRPYNHAYYPGEEGLYCSELLTECFLLDDGSRYFALTPMNFSDINGSIPEFWVKKYKQYGRTIPEGIPGSNPQKLYMQLQARKSR